MKRTDRPLEQIYCAAGETPKKARQRMRNLATFGTTHPEMFKGQTRLASFGESCANVAIGYGIAVASQVLIFPLFDIHVPLRSNLQIGLWFTAISIVRSYVLRRLFNRNRLTR